MEVEKIPNLRFLLAAVVNRLSSGTSPKDFSFDVSERNLSTGAKCALSFQM
jgi:hypothetical protein